MKYLIIVIFIKISLVATNNNCLPRDFGQGSIVCVCNEHHCDMIPKITKLHSSLYATYTSDKNGNRFTYLENLIQPLNKTDKIYPFNEICLDKLLKEYQMCSKNYKSDLEIYWNIVEKFNKTENDDVKTIIIDQEKRYQKIIGWGGAFTDSTGINIKSLNPDLQTKLLRLYFSEEGLEYNLGRVPVGGTDFSTHGYTYMDSIDDGNYCEDPLLTKFKLAKEDYKYKIPLIKEASTLNANLLLFASSWSSPKWMKQSRNYPGVLGYLKKEMYQPWANYFIKFLDAYSEENITFWAVTTGNEIFYAMGQLKIPGVQWIPEEMRDWLRYHFGPTIKNSSHSYLKILTLDDNRPILLNSVDTIFADPINQDYVDGIGIHWYFDNEYNAYMMNEIHERYPDKFLLYTEASAGYWDNTVKLGSWDRGEDYARNIIEDLNHWVTGWTDWNMALNTQGGPTYIDNFLDSPIIVNASFQEFYKQPTFYVIGHFSKFIPRDSIRIYSSQCDSEIQVVAFRRPDGGVVVIILNKTNNLQRRYLVDSSKGEIYLEINAHSITTVLYW